MVQSPCQKSRVILTSCMPHSVCWSTVAGGSEISPQKKLQVVLFPTKSVAGTGTLLLGSLVTGTWALNSAQEVKRRIRKKKVILAAFFVKFFMVSPSKIIWTT